MFRPATRLIARSTAVRALPRASAPARRHLNTAPQTQTSRSWKSLVARLGVAGAIIYYYNTTEVFAEEPRVHSLTESQEETAQLPTIEALAQERKQRRAEVAAAQEKEAAPAGGVEELEEEAGQQGAFNPETGEINWDCPCLGGMANGPCGEQFKAAFSCFVFSTEEPKGMDCIEKFKDMQNCFREYPEIYGAELEDDEEDAAPIDDALPEGAAMAHPETADATESQVTAQVKTAPQPHSELTQTTQSKEDGFAPETYRADVDPKTEVSTAATEQVKREHEPVSESETLVPRAAHTDTDTNEAKK